jgi:hypothetical protein
VPETFDEKRLGFIYTTVKHNISIEEHQLASRLPKSTNHPSAQASPTEFRSLARRPDAPTKLDDYLYSDEPPLSFHVESFEDATRLSLAWLHTFLDAMGRASLFHALTLVLEGKGDQVPPLHGFDFDPLASLGSNAVEPHLLEKFQIKGFGMFLFALRFIFELFWYRKKEDRIMCVPSSCIESMKQHALGDLGFQNPSTSNIKPFLSDGATICAWVNKVPETRSKLSLLLTLNQSLRQDVQLPLVIQALS